MGGLRRDRVSDPREEEEDARIDRIGGRRSGPVPDAPSRARRRA